MFSILADIRNQLCFVGSQWIHNIYRTGIYGYGYIHGYPRKICGHGYGYGWEISYPRQPWENPSEMVLHFCTFLPNPCFDLEPDYIFRKPIKRRFQWYIVRTKIFSTFHARVEYISQHSAHSNQWDWVCADTQEWKHNLCQFHSVQLANVIIKLVFADVFWVYLPLSFSAILLPTGLPTDFCGFSPSGDLYIVAYTSHVNGIPVCGDKSPGLVLHHHHHHHHHLFICSNRTVMQE